MPAMEIYGRDTMTALAEVTRKSDVTYIKEDFGILKVLYILMYTCAVILQNTYVLLKKNEVEQRMNERTVFLSVQFDGSIKN
jgi:hypothetical protein